MSESGRKREPSEVKMANPQGVRMTHAFQLVGIDPLQFEHLFSLSDEQLKRHAAQRRFADESPGYPCRVSLEDAVIGEELLLLPYVHQPASSPYRASGPILVRRGARQTRLPAGEVPSYVASRLISVRAYDTDHMIVSASVCEGVNTGHEINEHFRRVDVAYIHLHNAKRGCFSCEVVRV
jgi:hypothetical protein